MLPVILYAAHWPEKWLDAMGQAKVINYRLIEERYKHLMNGCSLHTVSMVSSIIK